MTATAEATVSITTPGVYTIPEHIYLADPVPGGSLSFSGAKALLPPSCPARFQYERENGRPNKPQYDFGHAVHSLLLGIGEPIVVVQTTAKDGTKCDAENYATKSAQQHRDAVYAAGHVPLLRADLDSAKAAVAAVQAHPLAERLFHAGTPEQSLFWRDERWDVTRRARVDWLTELTGGRPVAVDLKTCVSAEPTAIAKAVANYHYEQQHAWYTDGLAAVTGVEHTFLFVFVEKDPPHLVTVAELDWEAVEHGRRRNDRALEVYAECVATDTWPGYTDDIALISLPGWASREDFAA